MTKIINYLFGDPDSETGTDTDLYKKNSKNLKLIQSFN